ncbi:Exocyst complex subunit SEC6 [Trachipleistophora hominis]|uniref:Exocyst complex subunit SEC6 n=1 Tax=Trachipleistophora hominis TaxID=72359 RepID=L7JV98_TRAHO|nr:Exocyst complex subunit SEC6 [Trachipleistophora hominis]
MSLQELAKMLKTVDDLDKKLPAIIENPDLDARESAYNKKIESITGKILDIQKNLENTQSDLGESRRLVARITRAESNFMDLISNYNQIKKLSTTFFNMKKTRRYADKIDVKEIEGDIIKWDEFRWKIMYYSADLSEEKYLMIQPLVNDIEKRYLEWEIQVLKVGENFFTLDDYGEEYFSRENVLSMIVYEEKKDVEALRAKRGRDGSNPTVEKEYFALGGTKFVIDTDVIAGNERIKSTLEYDRAFYYANKSLCARPVRKLKLRFLKNVYKAISQREIYNAIGDLKLLFKTEAFDVNNENSIFVFYHAVLKSKINLSTLEAGDILNLLAFKKSYNTLLQAHSVTMTDDILDEERFIDRYLSVLQNKIALWISNITNLEVEMLKERSKAPPLDESNLFISTNFINLLKIIKEQLEPVTFDERIFKGVSRFILDSVTDFKNAIVLTLENEYKSAISLSSTPGYEEYAIMIGNSGLKLTQYIANIPQCQNVEISELGEIFISIVKSSNHFLIKFVLATLKPAIKELFTERYYAEKNLKQITATLKDFLDDYKECMNEYVFVTFVNDLAAEFSTVYFKQLIKKKSLIYQSLCDNIENDQDVMNRLFWPYVNEDIVNLTVLNPLLVTRSVDTFIAETKNVLYTYEFKKDFIKSLIKKRSDLDANEIKELTDAVNSVYVSDDGTKKKKSMFKMFKFK